MVFQMSHIITTSATNVYSAKVASLPFSGGKFLLILYS